MEWDQQLMEKILEKNRPLHKKGRVASYIPELGSMEADRLGLTLVDVNGADISGGDCGLPFTLQSISKVISLMIVLENLGFEKVFAKVGVEPSGEPFNSITKLETTFSHKPLNPMINAGAIAVASMIPGTSVDQRFKMVLDFIRTIADNGEIKLDEAVYNSEKKTGDRNRSLAYFMKSTGIIETGVEEALDLYFRLCSIQVTCHDLAKIGTFLANQGKLHGNQHQLIRPSVIKATLTIMFTAGMYNESGESAMRIGFPAKSGVSGGILAVVPHKVGIGIIGPAINKKGNSVAGMATLSDLSDHYGWHLLI